jgi:hypothetical protein
VMAMMMVAMMVMAVVMAMAAVATVPAVATMPVPTGKRGAIDRQRGSAQCENRNRRHNEFPDLGHSHSPICAARVSPAVIGNVDALNSMRCDGDHSGRRSVPVPARHTGDA